MIACDGGLELVPRESLLRSRGRHGRLRGVGVGSRVVRRSRGRAATAQARVRGEDVEERHGSLHQRQGVLADLEKKGKLIRTSLIEKKPGLEKS